MIRAYVDNDAVFKMAKCNLLEQCRKACSIPTKCVVVLPTLKYVIGTKSETTKAKWIKKHGEAAYGKISQFLSAVSEMNSEPKGWENIVECVNIDPGEALLFLACAEDRESVLLTGDKRSLRALSTDPLLTDTKHKLSGRVYCVEQQFLRMIQRYGFEFILNSVIPCLNSSFDFDTALTAAFAARDMAVQSNTELILRSYVADLASQAPGLLCCDSDFLAD
jgi:hypothetical protein